MSNELQPAKGYWQRPENYFTWAFLIFLGCGFLYGLNTILPFLIGLMLNLYTFIGLLAGLAVIGWLVFSKDFHLLLWYGYRSLMRYVTQVFIEIDPIAIMKTYVEHLKDNLSEMKQSISSLNGQAMRIKDLMDNATHDMQQSRDLALQAKKRADQSPDMKRTMLLQARKAGKLEESTLTYQGLYNKLQAHIRVAQKMYEAAAFMAEDIQDTVKLETEKRDAIRASYKAMASARRIMQGDEQRQMYDMALEATNRDYFQKLGEIDQFMQDSKDFMSTMDLQNGVFEENALSKLEAWEQRSDELIGTVGKSKQLSGISSRVPALPSGVPDAQIVEVNNDFSDLFNTSGRK